MHVRRICQKTSSDASGAEVKSMCGHVMRGYIFVDRGARWNVAWEFVQSYIFVPFLYWDFSVVIDDVNRFYVKIRNWCLLFEVSRLRGLLSNPNACRRNNAGISFWTDPLSVMFYCSVHYKPWYKCSYTLKANSFVFWAGQFWATKPFYKLRWKVTNDWKTVF